MTNVLLSSLFALRITESWLTIGFAARLAIAHGCHIKMHEALGLILNIKY